MNKAGHVALGVAAGSAMLSFLPQTEGQLAWPVVYILAVAAGSLAPDLDHKTSTASNLIQLSTQNRRLAQSLGLLFLLIAAALWGLPRLGLDSVWVRSAPLWAAGGVLSLLLAKLRSLVLLGAGALLLAAYAMYDWHWFTALAGGALLILPMVKHRGIIHTPEFAIALSVAAFSYGQQSEIWLVEAISMGLIVGWWAHLIGDLFGREGIASLISKKIHIALRLFDNGGAGERLVSGLCWGISTVCWLLFFMPVEWRMEVLPAWLL